MFERLFLFSESKEKDKLQGYIVRDLVKFLYEK